MFEQRGIFSGIDTCNNVEVGGFEKHSILQFKNENKAISNCSNINRYLETLCHHKCYKK